MKRIWKQEFALLLSPIAIIGIIAFWRVRTGGLKDPGPPHVVVTDFKLVPLTPLEVFQGYGVKVGFKVDPVGVLQLPPDDPPTPISMAFKPALRTEYLRGEKWKVLRNPDGSSPGTVGMGDADYYMAKLGNLPSGTTEIRLRGRYGFQQDWSSVIPRPSFDKNSGVVVKGTIVVFKPAQLDFPIQTKGSSLPSTVVSRVPCLELRDTLRYSGNQEMFFVRLHFRDRRTSSDDFGSFVQKLNIRLFDGKNRRLALWVPDRMANGRPLYKISDEELSEPYGYSRSEFSPKLPATDAVLRIIGDEITPSRPWASYPQPLRFEFDVSDGTCWPLHVSAKFDMRKPAGTMETFGGSG